MIVTLPPAVLPREKSKKPLRGLRKVLFYFFVLFELLNKIFIVEVETVEDRLTFFIGWKKDLNKIVGALNLEIVEAPNLLKCSALKVWGLVC